MALFVVTVQAALVAGAGAGPALPTAMQLAYQAREVSMFMVCDTAPPRARWLRAPLLDTLA